MLIVIIKGGGGGGGGGGSGGGAWGIVCRDISEKNGKGGGGGGAFEICGGMFNVVSSTGTGNTVEFCFFLNMYFSSIIKSSSVLTNPCFMILFVFDKLNSFSYKTSNSSVVLFNLSLIVVSSFNPYLGFLKAFSYTWNLS